MQQDLPNLVDERRFRRRDNPEPVERDEFGRVRINFSLPSTRASIMICMGSVDRVC
jgi:hypothetical protein